MGQAVGFGSGRLIGVGKNYEVGAVPVLDRLGRAMSDEDLKVERRNLKRVARSHDQRAEPAHLFVQHHRHVAPRDLPRRPRSPRGRRR